MKYIFPTLCLFIIGCDSSDNENLEIIGNWYGGRYNAIEPSDDFTCTHFTLYFNKTFIIEEPSTGTIIINGNYELINNEEFIMTFDTILTDNLTTDFIMPAIYTIENSMLMINYYEDFMNAEDIINEDLYGEDFDYFYMKMEDVGIYNCYDDKDTDGIVDIEDECVSRYLELDCNKGCNTICEDENDYNNDFIIHVNYNKNVIIKLYDNCFNEYILDENYLEQGENKIDFDDFDDGYYKIVIHEDINDDYPLLNHTFFLCNGEREIPPPEK